MADVFDLELHEEDKRRESEDENFDCDDVSIHTFILHFYSKLELPINCIFKIIILITTLYSSMF